MVLVPPYVAVDGLVVPLAIYEANAQFPRGVVMAPAQDRPFLKALYYVVNAMLSRPRDTDWLGLLAQGQRLPMSRGLAAGPLVPGISGPEELEVYVSSWERAAGARPDPDECYLVSAYPARDSLLVPRTTFIKLMEKLFELDDAVHEGRMEPTIDTSIPIPPPPPEPREPSQPWENTEWWKLEERLAELAELDPLVPEQPELEPARRAARQRGSLFSVLDVAWRRTLVGDDDLPARAAELQLPNLQAVCEASDRLLAYLHDPERLAIVKKEPPDSPFMADVSIDLFRLPAAPYPDGYRRHEWLAYCEALFIEKRGPVENVAGDLLTRIDGFLVRLRYRAEAGDHLYLWRVELI